MAPLTRCRASAGRVPNEMMRDYYIQRASADFPQQGTSGPWTIEMDYWADHSRLRKGPVDDPALKFSTARPAVVAPELTSVLD